VVSEPKGESLTYGLKLNHKLNITNIEGDEASFKKIDSLLLKTSSIEAGLIKSDSKELSIDGTLNYNKEHAAVTLGVEHEFTTGPYQKTRLRIAPKKDTPAYHSLVIQSKAGEKKNAFQDSTTHLVVKGDGSVGIGAFHKLGAKLTLSGEGPLLCLRDSTTPTSKDKSPIGTFAWDDVFFYIKTNTGWKKTKLDNL